MAETTSNRKLPWILFVVVTAIALIIGFLVLRVSGQRSGEEFSPDDFTTRQFSFEVLPLLGWTMRGVVYDNSTPEICELIVADGLITVDKPAEPNWVLIRDNRSSGKTPANCDARLLTRYLNDRDNEGKPYWVQWNEKFPKSAVIFWPMVAELARADMYLSVPDVMELARRVQKDEPQPFESELDSLVSRLYFEFGSLDGELARHQLAVDRLTRSIELSPSAKAYQARAVSYDALGKSELAENDRSNKDAG